jgi:hypothetical protein
MSAESVMVSTTSIHEGRAGSIPSPALQSIIVRPIPTMAAKKILVKNHYLHSFPGCTELCFGAFSDNKLLGAITFGAGPANAFRLVEGVSLENCLTLTRLWLSEELPSNSESKVISISIRYIKKFTKLKFLVTYADPTQGHVGTIYQATGWIYTGFSEAMPKFDLGDGIARHSRSLSHAFGSHSLKYFSEHGLEVKVLPQLPKHRYIYLLDQGLRNKITTPVLPYPKKENEGRVRGLGTTYDDSSSLIPLCVVTGKDADEDR